jgi:hypothetical protein
VQSICALLASRLLVQRLVIEPAKILSLARWRLSAARNPSYVRIGGNTPEMPNPGAKPVCHYSSSCPCNQRSMSGFLSGRHKLIDLKTQLAIKGEHESGWQPESKENSHAMTYIPSAMTCI